jgi:hypothetical protein
MRGSSSRKTIHTFDEPFIFDSECLSGSPPSIRKHTTPMSFGLMKSDIKKRTEKE